MAGQSGLVGRLCREQLTHNHSVLRKIRTLMGRFGDARWTHRCSVDVNPTAFVRRPDSEIAQIGCSSPNEYRIMETNPDAGPVLTILRQRPTRSFPVAG